MSVIRAFFGLGKLPKVVKYFEFQSFDDVNKMGGAIRAIREEARTSGAQLTKSQQKYLDDQQRQVEMVFEQLQQPTTETGIRGTRSAKIIDMQGKEITPGSKIMGGKASETDAEIKARIEKGNKKAVGNMRKKNLRDDISKLENKRDARALQLEQRGVEDFETDDLYNNINEQINDLELKLDFEDMVDPEDLATGGRVGLKMGRRAFLKLMGGAAAGLGALKAGALKMFGKEGARQVTKNVIKTDPVPGKPEWFDTLVTKVINEGDDVTKRFATGERQSVYQKRLGDDTVVRVTQDADEGAIRVEYESPDNVFGDPVQLDYKKPLPDEANPNPSAEFTTAESGPVGRQVGPDDYDIDVDEVGGTSIKDLDSDLSKLKQYATGKKPTLKEFVQNKKRRDKAQRITDDPEEQSDAVVRRQGEMLDYDGPDDDFASGGIARMLGE